MRKKKRAVDYYLKFWMSIKFIEEVHDSVCLEHGSTYNNMSFILSSVTTVCPTLFLLLQPSISQLLKLVGADKYISLIKTVNKMEPLPLHNRH